MITTKTEPDTPEALERILHPLVRRWFFSRFPSFSLPQRYGVMEIQSRKNILISAPTGATKTLTAFLSVLNELVDSAEKGILADKTYAVYVSPLKALNEDIRVNLLTPLREIEEIAGHRLGIRVGVRTGDTTAYEKSIMLKRPPHIFITTPESLAIVLSSKKFVQHLTDVQWAILDEVHALFENKRGVHLSLSLERLQRFSPAMTRVGLSATVAPIEEVARHLVGYQADERGRFSQRPCLIVDVQFLKELDLKVISPVADLIGTTHQQMQDALYKLLHELIQEHTTTLIFTNTRAATERVVDTLKDRYPKHYGDNIGAHHGSLSKEFRHGIEQRLREGKLKVAVSSTSLELGIDIGAIDLVLLLGSPKSVARALQRIGRSGHSLHAVTKGRIVVTDRDDLVECALLLKSAVEKKIDRIHLPDLSLDVLVQHIYGIAIEGPIAVEELFRLIRQSAFYRKLSREDFMASLHYLNGDYADLEERHIYRKIRFDEAEQTVRASGRLARMLYMTNIGTIPDEAGVKVKVGNEIIGIIDEAFLERLRRGDVFVLGGSTYEFLYTRGTVAQVKATAGRPPTVPSWFSEMLPLSYDLACTIGHFRRIMEEHLKKEKKEEVLAFLHDYLYVDDRAANAIYEYFREQYKYAVLPSDRRILVEYLEDERGYKAIFHTLYGRRVNDALSRAVGYVVHKNDKTNVEIGINDNGFTLATNKRINGKRALQFLRSDKMPLVLAMSIEHSEVLKRRFRHCATRSLMILRNYMGRTKHVGRQAVNALMLMNAVKRISPNFLILKEARREVLEDMMDQEHAAEVIASIENGKIAIKEIMSRIPSPFAFNLVLQGYLDILKIDDKIEFLRRMHEQVIASISLSEGKAGMEPEDFSIGRLHEKMRSVHPAPVLSKGQQQLVMMVTALEDLHDREKLEILELIKQNTPLSNHMVRKYQDNRAAFGRTWPKRLLSFLDQKIGSDFSYQAYWEDEAKLSAMEAEEAMDKALVDLHKAVRKVRLSDTVKDELFGLVTAKEPLSLSLSDETVDWLDAFFSGPIPFVWSDHLVKWLQERYREWEEARA